jgi:GNAT superfamily N-acetyltransferase
MYRRTEPADHPILIRMAEETGVFYPHEMDVLAEVLNDFERDGDDYGHQCQVLEQNGSVVGFHYFAPVAMTDNTWELWWIVVDKAHQGQGLGKQMLTEMLRQIQDQHGRLLLIETSSLPHYEPTRQFYLRTGFREVARVPDFYRQGDDKVIFSRTLTPAVASV